jgi:competence protein ComEC
MGVLVAIATGLLGGAWAAVLGARFELAWVGCVAVLGIGLLIAVSSRRATVRPARRAWPLWAALAALAGQALAPAAAPAVEVPSGTTRLEGTVERTLHGRRPRAVLRVEEGATLDGTERVPTGARLEIRGLDAATGARVRALARIHPVARFDNPTPHPDWPDARPVDGRGRLHGRPRVERAAPPWHRLSHALRTTLRERFWRTLSAPAAALAQALLLGESRALPYEDRQRVRDAGLSHVLAVSGLHVTLLAGALVWLLFRALLHVERLAARFEVARIAKALGVPVALGYAALVGDAPSAWRAAVTASIAWGLGAAGRRAHPVTVTAAAALVLGVLRPDDLGRPGFVLSIVATASLVADLGGSAERSWVRAGLAVGARTMLATAPLVLWMFGQVPLVGLLANLVVVPVAAAMLLPLLAGHALLVLLAPPLAHLTGPLADAVARAFLAACEVFASVPLGHDLPPPDLAQGVVVTLACLGLLAARRWRTRGLVAGAAALALFGAELHLRHREAPRDVLRATFLDVGQGDAALVDLPDGRLMVVDAGGATGGPDPGARVLVPLLRARRRSRIDVFVLSHPHPDHYGGLEALLEAVEVGEIWDSGQAEIEMPEGPVAQMLRRARARGTRVRRPPELCGRPRAYGAAVARVLWPCPDYDAGWGPNDNSVVVELTMGRHRMLLTGDAEAHAEAGMLASGALRPVDVLKVGHHGSRTSTGSGFLAPLRPRVAVVSAGRANRFGHPHAEVWNRLLAGVEAPFRTDLDGGVTVWSDGRRLHVRSSRSSRSRVLRPRKRTRAAP